jgi:hypothetical protein
VQDGMPKEKRGVYNLLNCYNWRLMKLESENEILKTSGDVSRYKVQTEGDKIKNKLMMTKLKRELNQLVRKQDILVAWGNQNNIIGSKTEMLKEDLKRDVIHHLPKEARKKVMGIIEKLVNSYKLYISKLELEKYIIDEEKIIEDADEISIV